LRQNDAKGFGMNVVACDVAPNAAAAKEIGYDYLEFDALLRRSDVVSLHVPADDSTKHMISGREFELMKDGVVLINTARGSVIDVRSLLGALASGKVAAAGLDVLPEEPVIREEAELLRSVFSKKHDLESLLADHILLRLRNVLITPHSAFNTREAVQRILDTTRANIDAFIAGKSQNIVSRDARNNAEFLKNKASGLRRD
jgi:D-lactate dehydrogenase